jgi:predicted transcriptional regulator
MFKEIEKLITKSLSDYNKAIADELNVDISIINDICSKFFSIESKQPIIKKKKENIKKCSYIFIKGKKSNEECGASIKNDTDFYCSKHSKFYKKSEENAVEEVIEPVITKVKESAVKEPEPKNKVKERTSKEIAGKEPEPKTKVKESISKEIAGKEPEPKTKVKESISKEIAGKEPEPKTKVKESTSKEIAGKEPEPKTKVKESPKNKVKESAGKDLQTVLGILSPDIKKITNLNPTQQNKDKTIEELLNDIFNDENEEIY